MKVPFVALCVFSVLLCAGCGDAAGKTSVDSAPFDKAIAEYLSERHMDMKVSKFKDVKVDGAAATARCAMKASEVQYGVSVEWTFSLEKLDDGRWKVVGVVK